MVQGGSEPVAAILVKSHRLFTRMTAWPEVIGHMRQRFLDALEESGLATRESLRREALETIALSGEGNPEEALVQEYLDVLTDLRFASAFSDETIEATINFARKQYQFTKLSLALNQEDSSYGKIRKELLAFCGIPRGGRLIPPNEAEGARVGLISRLISNQLPFIGIAKQHITVRDVGELVPRILRTPRRSGRIGGKAAGMILAHRILVPRLTQGDPELAAVVRIPESWYINTGVFSEFIDANDLHQFHAHKYRTREEIEKEYHHLQELFRRASFPEDVTETFRELLRETGEHPLLLRSSSLLEDNFGFAFSGKYDSVFLANQGDLDQRLREFIQGLKKVHMSVFGPAPILYRRKNNLIDFNEQMSVLVQKVVGRRFGRYFFPFAAGVGFSFSSYSWTPRIRKEDGVMRLVLGLGTRAVNRIGEDYPRMVPLSSPLLRPEVTPDRIRRYSQKLMDVLDLETGTVESMHYADVLKDADHPDLFLAISEEKDGLLEPPMFRGRAVNLDGSCITFDNLLKNTPLPRVLKKALKALEAAYGRPVDVEFAWDGGLLWVVQCRTLSVARDEAVVMPGDIPEGDLLFRNNRILSGGAVRGLEYVVYVDPRAYAALRSVEARMEAARAVSLINRRLEGRRYALFGPGRWGSSDITLGVRAGYEDINNALVLGEVAFEKDGTTPEVSYGTHFFNDLVEAGIVHVAVFPDDPESFFRESFLLDSPNRLSSLVPEAATLEGVIHLIRVPDCCRGRSLSVFQDSRRQQGAGFFETTREPMEE
jgi:hypothetical protein